MDVKGSRRGSLRAERPSTIHDIAEMAGVSITTVSQALNGRGRIAQATRERVSRIASELGYKANVHAQRLVAQRSRTLAIQISYRTEPSNQTSFLPHSAYFLELLDGASATAAELGYALILTPPNTGADQLGGLAIDGAIVVDPHGDEPLFRALVEREQPLVTTGRAVQAGHQPAVIDNDHRGAAIGALDHLEASGFKRPALITTDVSRSYTADILNGYLQWTAERDMPSHVAELSEPPVEAAVAAAVRDLLKRADPPDAVYASSEDLALGVFHEAKRLGMSLPEDLGIASAVDSDVLLLTSPQITGVFLHPRQIGSEAVSTLVSLVEGGSPQSQDVSVPTTLNPRGSTIRRRC